MILRGMERKTQLMMYFILQKKGRFLVKKTFPHLFLKN